MTRKLIYFGFTGPVLFIAAMAMFSALTPGYGNLHNALSELGVRTAPHAAAWNVLGFGLLGVQLIGFAIGFLALTRARVTSALIALTGAGFIGAGLISAEPGFAPSTQTSLHFTLAALSYFPFIVAALVFGLVGVRKAEWRGLAIASLITAALALATFLLPRTLPAGLVQRMGFLIYFAWLMLAAWRLGEARPGILAFGGAGVAIWVLWVSAPFVGARPSPTQDAAAFKRHLDARAPSLLERFGVPGVSIATVAAGQPADAYAYGFADLAQRRPMTSDTVFEVASISKSFTAWGVMGLVEADRLALDAPVERYITPWPMLDSSFAREAVTVRRLLDHTAGVNPGNLGVRDPDEPPLSTRDVLRGLGQHPALETAGPTRLEFPAGQRFLYSNPGYTLLQLAIEQQTQQPFAGFMKRAVLDRMSMTSSSFDWDAALRARTATPYGFDGSASLITILNDQATGSLFSTAPDLAKFIAAGLSDAPAAGLSRSARSALYAPSVALPTFEVQGLASDAGALGHYVEQLADGHIAIMNGGFASGWTSQFYQIPDAGDGIVVLTNSDRGRAVIAEIVADWAAWRGLPALKMTRTYGWVGVLGPVLIGALGLLALAIACNVMSDIMRNRRRVFRVTFGSGLRAALLAPALVLGVVWFGFARSIAMFGFPWLEAPMSAMIVALGIALALSALLPPAPLSSAIGD